MKKYFSSVVVLTDTSVTVNNIYLIYILCLPEKYPFSVDKIAQFSSFDQTFGWLMYTKYKVVVYHIISLSMQVRVCL